MRLPQLRDEIEIAPFYRNGEEFLLLYDCSGVSSAQLELTGAALPLLVNFDGEHSWLALQDLYAAAHGAALPLAALENLLTQLDAADFLATARFADYYADLQRHFYRLPTRAATSAGGAYSADAAELARELQHYLDTAPAPEEEDRVTTAIRPAPRAVIAPHLDFSRGGKIYGQVYRELAAYAPPAAVMVIGTAHYHLQHRYAVCPKNFALPGGEMRVATELIRELLARAAPVADFTADLLAHRNEHSIELQLVWLRHIWGAELPIIPVLAAPIDDLIAQAARNAAPEEAVANDRPDWRRDSQIEIFAAITRELVAREKIMVLAAADLSHIGRGFGEAAAWEESFLQSAADADRHYLAAVKNGDAVGAVQSLARHNDAYNVCGAGCIYAVNSVLPRVGGRLLGYHQAITPEREQAVGCAGLIFE